MTREEAIKRIRDWHLDDDDIEVLAAAIPELNENVDEMINIGVKEPLSKTFPRVNEFEEGASYRH